MSKLSALICVLALVTLGGRSALAEEPISPPEQPWEQRGPGYRLECALAPTRGLKTASFRPSQRALASAPARPAPRLQETPEAQPAAPLSSALRVGDRVLSVEAGSLSQTLRAERFAPLTWRGQAAYDLTGDGAEDVLISAWEGRRARLWLLQTGSRPSLTRLPGWHGPLTFLRDLDGDARPELVTHDDSLRGWRGVSMADSPAPRIALQWTEGEWRLAPELLGAATPSPAELAARAAALRARFQDEAPVELWAALLELEANGHGELAESFLAQAWPSERPGRAEFWLAYRARRTQVTSSRD